MEDGLNRVAVLKSFSDEELASLQTLLRTGRTERSFLSVAETVEDELEKPHQEFRDWLQETIGRLQPNKPAILNALVRLQLPIATTNYDTLIERASRRRPITCKNQREALEFARAENPLETVLHLHGKYDEPDSVVLGIKSYEELLRDGHAEAILRALTIRYALLFVGFGAGLKDPNFKKLVDWIENILKGEIHCHFRLVTDTEWNEQAQELRQRQERIIPIPYGLKHDALPGFLESLRGSVRVERVPSKTRTVGESAGALPPEQRPCIGRNPEIRALSHALMADVPEPVVVLGTAGIGKSTVCLAALHAPDVAARYGRRRKFVRLDAARSGAALIAEVATAINAQVTLEPSKQQNLGQSDLIARIIERLSDGPTALVLDSAEIPWDADEPGTEYVLSQLANTVLPGRPPLGLVVAVRGRLRPLGVPWKRRVDLLPLSDEDSRDVFLQIAAPREDLRLRNDRDFEPLIGALDGNPWRST